MAPFIPSKQSPSKPSLFAAATKKKPSLFDTLETVPKQANASQKLTLLSRIGCADSDSSSLSEHDSNDFEDVDIASPSAKRRKLVDELSEDEDEMEWEDAIG